MAAIAGKNTSPELRVRKLLHSLGYRYKIHMRELPGRPDIVFTRRRKIVDIRGCFWHRHPGCHMAATPTIRKEFWERKLAGTVDRDERNSRALELAGWKVFVVWECQLNDVDIAARLRAFL